MSWAPVGHRGTARHAPAFAKDGSTYASPPLALCTGREARIETVLPERIDCKRCLAKLRKVPTLQPARREWMQVNGIDGVRGGLMPARPLSASSKAGS